MKPSSVSAIELEQVCGGIRSIATCGAAMLGGTSLGVADGRIPSMIRGVPTWVGRAGMVLGGIAGAYLTYTQTDACK
jgi:hypothetical protein